VDGHSHHDHKKRGTLFQLAVSPFNWIDGVMEDLGQRVGMMLDSEATCAPAGDEVEEQSLEDLRKKYPWWLVGREGVEASAPTKESSAKADDTVTSLRGSLQEYEEVMKTTSSRGVYQTE
jgi:hypothetical protein